MRFCGLFGQQISVFNNEKTKKGQHYVHRYQVEDILFGDIIKDQEKLKKNNFKWIAKFAKVDWVSIKYSSRNI